MFLLSFFFPIYLFIYLFIYLWLQWVFVAVGFSLVAVSAGYPCSAQTSHCSGFSCCGARALGAQASVVVAHGLSSCGLRAYLLLLHGRWDLPGPGLEPVSPGKLFPGLSLSYLLPMKKQQGNQQGHPN